MLLSHLDGIPFRKVSDSLNISLGSAYTKCFELVKRLPDCADLTRRYCSVYSGTLVVDGKFVKVKGYDYKIPFLYGIDYQTHDIPTYKMATNESYQSWLSYFTSLRLLNYPLQTLICDDNENIRLACKDIYPRAIFQLCQNHYKENVRRSLDLTNNPIYIPFMKDIERLFSLKRSNDDFNRIGKDVFLRYKDDSLCLGILLDIDKRKDILLGYLKCKGTPTTTNLIESFNSHFEARFRPLKGFEDFKHADYWINAFIIRRRLRRFTDCRGKFKDLNGKSSLEKSLKPNVDLPTLNQILSDRF